MRCRSALRSAGSASGQEPTAIQASRSGPGATGRALQAATAVAEDKAEPVGEASMSDTAAAFEAAAMRLKAQREVEQMPIEDKIATCFKQWSAEWQADMDARSEEVKDSSSGYVGTVQFEQTMAFFKALYKQLRHRQVGFKGSGDGAQQRPHWQCGRLSRPRPLLQRTLNQLNLRQTGLSFQVAAPFPPELVCSRPGSSNSGGCLPELSLLSCSMVIIARSTPSWLLLWLVWQPSSMRCRSSHALPRRSLRAAMWGF